MLRDPVIRASHVPNSAAASSIGGIGAQQGPMRTNASNPRYVVARDGFLIILRAFPGNEQIWGRDCLSLPAL
jgi:hypothetical protein